MKILIIHSKEGKLKELSEGIAEGARAKDHNVDVIDTDGFDTGKPVTFFPYDLVLVGSPAKGFFKGRIAPDISPFLQSCKRTSGQETMAFVTPNFLATTKALKVLMGELEKLGCIVQDFRSLKVKSDAVDFGKKL